MCERKTRFHRDRCALVSHATSFVLLQSPNVLRQLTTIDATIRPVRWTWGTLSHPRPPLPIVFLTRMFLGPPQAQASIKLSDRDR